MRDDILVLSTPAITLIALICCPSISSSNIIIIRNEASKCRIITLVVVVPRVVIIIINIYSRSFAQFSPFTTHLQYNTVIDFKTANTTEVKKLLNVAYKYVAVLLLTVSGLLSA